MPPSPLRVSLFAAAFATLLGCSSETDEPALDIALVPDLNLNRPEQVVAQLDTVVIFVDSPAGLYPPGSEQAFDNVVVTDTDGDPSDLELVATAPVAQDSLPWIRLEAGGLPDVPLDIRIIGVDSAVAPELPRASGQVSGVRFGQGRTPISIPFNIRPDLLPPRVTEIVPPESKELPGCTIGHLSVIFSKAMDLPSLLEPGRVMFEPGGAPMSIELDEWNTVAYVALPTIEGDPTLQTLSYRMTISSEVLDESGRPLDQVPSEAGPQDFDQTFLYTCGPPPSVPAHPCGGAGPEPPQCPDRRLECIDGLCVPATCDGSECPAAFVCSPLTSRCEVDCRLYGGNDACSADRPSCDGTTGVCQ